MTNTIYIGEKVPGAMKNQIFRTRPQKVIEGLKEQYPLIELLFVPAEKLQAAQAELQTPGTPRYKAYMQTK